MVEIYAIKKVPEKEFEKRKMGLLDFLPPESAESINTFKKPEDFQRSLLGESLLRALLSIKTGKPAQTISIKRSAKGKPMLKDNKSIHFNISHSGDWVVVAVSGNEVGIDIEKIRPPHYRIAERYFSKHELQTLNELQDEEKKNYFFDLWTLKESYLKLLGKGLTKSLGSFTIARTGSGFELITNSEKDETIHFFQMALDPNYKLSVCSLSSEWNEKATLITIDELINKMNDGKKR